MPKPRTRRSATGAEDTADSPAVVETTVFRSGNSDAVRLPRRFAFAGQRVRLRRLSGGRVLIEPVRRRRWPAGFLESFGRVSADFGAPERPAASADAERRAAALFDTPPPEGSRAGG
jgi:virulence-associated protein VagC